MPDSSSPSLFVGFGEADITPPFPHPMAGFGQARTACHEGVHDRIAARSAVFENNGEHFAMVSCEVIGLRAEIIGRIRRAIPFEWGLRPERVVITCTHTHGAPVIEGDYVPFLIEKIVESLSQAWAARKLRRIALARKAHEEWIGFNRRALETGFLPVDKEVQTLVVEEMDGRICGLLFHYACHPSILGPDNLSITADWPGYARRALQRELSADVAILYLKGTEGDINTGYSAGVSSLGIKIPTRTYETAARVGEVIARTIVASLDEAVLVADPTIRFGSQPIWLDYRSAASLPDCRDQLAERARRLEEALQKNEPADQVISARVAHAYAGFEVAALEFIVASGTKGVWTEQTALRIGGAGFVSFPGEFFVESGLLIKRETKAAFAFPLGITCDYLGYFPPEGSFGDGGYEVACARFAKSTAGEWCERGVALLNSLFK